MKKTGLFGYWQLESLGFMNIDTWENEVPISGTAVFTEAGFMNLYTHTTQFSFGLFGKFFVEDEKIYVSMDFCTTPEMKDKRFTLAITSANDKDLTLSMVDDATGLTYESHFRLITRRFLNTSDTPLNIDRNP